MGFWNKIKQLNDDSIHDRDSQPKQEEKQEPKRRRTGLISGWLQREDEQNQYNKTHTTHGFTIGGNTGFSITRNKQLQDETSYIRTTEIAWLTDEQIENNYDIVGYSDGMYVVRKRK